MQYARFTGRFGDEVLAFDSPAAFMSFARLNALLDQDANWVVPVEASDCREDLDTWEEHCAR